MNPPISSSVPDDVARQCSLLLVDDDEEFLEILERRFKRRGLSVAIATSPQSALETAGRDSFHVAIVDRSLGGVDGIDLMAQLRECQKQLQVILLSGHGDADAIALARSRGAFEYLVKPCALADLETAVADAFACYG